MHQESAGREIVAGSGSGWKVFSHAELRESNHVIDAIYEGGVKLGPVLAQRWRLPAAWPAVSLKVGLRVIDVGQDSLSQEESRYGLLCG